MGKIGVNKYRNSFLRDRVAVPILLLCINTLESWGIKYNTEEVTEWEHIKWINADNACH